MNTHKVVGGYPALDIESLGVAGNLAAKGNGGEGASTDVATKRRPSQSAPFRKAEGGRPTTVIIERRILNSGLSRQMPGWREQKYGHPILFNCGGMVEGVAPGVA